MKIDNYIKQWSILCEQTSPFWDDEAMDAYYDASEGGLTNDERDEMAARQAERDAERQR